MKTLPALGLLVLTLIACAPVAEGVERSVVAWRKTARTIQGKPEPERLYKSAYCYRTLADYDCYDTPQPGQEHRFSGYTAIPMQAVNVNYHTGPGSTQTVDIAEGTYSPPLVQSSPLPPPTASDGRPKDLIEFQVGDKTYSNQNMPSEQDLSF